MAGHETILETPRHIVKAEMVLPPGAAPAKPIELQQPTQEQVLAADEYFAQVDDPEAQAIAGMMGLWTGTMILNDLLAEHLRRPSKEEEEEDKPVPQFRKQDDRDEE